MRVFENRASAVLYYFLKSNTIERPFLLPANVCPVVPLTFRKANVAFEFVDIDYTHAVDIKKCKDKLSSGIYGGILFVHAYGRLFDNSDFYSWVKELDSSLYIIDDRCLCMPRLTEIAQVNVDLELYSTGYAKYIELSYGGWGIIQDHLKYVRTFLSYKEEDLRWQMEKIRHCLEFGLRYTFEDCDWIDNSMRISPSLYMKKIERNFERVNAHKEQINAIYQANIPQSFQFGNEYNHWRFMLDIPKRKKVLQSLSSKGLFAGTNFPSVAFLFRGIHLPVAEKEQRCVLNLFNDFRVDENFAKRVCAIINSEITG